MKKTTIIATLLVASSSAFAADLPVAPYKATLAAPALTWSGFYVGGNAGYASGSWSGSPTYSLGPSGMVDTTVNANGFLGGVQAGYNWQIGKVVYGIETDFQLGSMSGSGVSNSTFLWNGVQPGFTKYYDMDMDWYGTLRGRLGYDLGGWMPYATGGLAYGHGTLSNTVVNNYLGACCGSGNGVSATGTAADTHIGWAAGAGLEYALNGNWSVKAEYLHVNLGAQPYSISGTITPLSGGPAAFNTDGFRSTLSFDTIKGGINYRF